MNMDSMNSRKTIWGIIHTADLKVTAFARKIKVAKRFYQVKNIVNSLS